MIIGICGLIGSGKGTVADVLVEQGFTKISFADKLKDGVAAVYGWDRAMLEGDTPESREWREAQDDFWTNETGRIITPRIVLQEFGTDCMRNGFYDGVWVSAVKQILINNPNVDYVIPDVRFENEVDMIRQVGGQVWEVSRGNDPEWMDAYKKTGTEPVNIHPSEWRWTRSKKDHKIPNDGSMQDLTRLVLSLHASIQS